MASPEVAAVSALTGYITDPTKYISEGDINLPKHFLINDNSIIPPAEKGENVEIVKGPNIKPFLKESR